MKAEELVDCAELVPDGGGLGPMVRCNAPAEVTRTARIASTDGLIQHIETLCVLGHRLLMPAQDSQQTDRQ